MQLNWLYIASRWLVMALVFIGGVIAQLDYNVGRTGEYVCFITVISLSLSIYLIYFRIEEVGKK